MNILFSSDDNYARHMGVAITSILINNTNSQRIRFYIVDNNISKENKEKIQKIIHNYSNSELIYIPFKKWSDNLHLNMFWPISISAYARLFIGEMLPKEVERVLYLDSDILVNGDLSTLWNMDLGDNVIGAVQDQVSNKIKVGVGLSPVDQYFNSGVLLIDLRRWNEMDIGQKSRQFLDSHEGHVLHHDQGVLNGIFKNCWHRLPLKYNVMTIHYMMPQKKIRHYFDDMSSFYDENEINEAMQDPCILHYTPSFTSRPWEENCKHPLLDRYRSILDNTPWANYPLEKERNPWYLKMINWFHYKFSKR